MKAGWEVKKLGEVCSLITRGIAPKYIENGGVRVLNQKCIRGHSINFDLARRNNSELKRVPDTRLIEIGDVLVNSTGTGTLGRVAQVLETPSEPTSVDTHVTIVRPVKDCFYPAFFGYMLIQIEDELIAAGQGTSGQTELPKKDLEAKFEVSYPTALEEQKRIVSILDEAFEGLDRARENAEANLKSASELFGRYLDVAFQSQLDFKNVPLENLVEVVSGYSFASGDFNEENPIKSIKITNVGVKEFIKTTTENLPATFAIDYKRFCIPTGSIVISLTRSIIAGGLKVALVPTEFSGALLNQRVAALKVPNDASLRDFLYFYMSSSAVLDYVQKSANTLMQPNLSINDLKRLPVPIPKEQKIGKFVDVAMKLSKQTSELQVHYTSKLQDISDLRQSLLQKAFAGELT